MSKDSEHEKNQQTTDVDEKNKTPRQMLSVLSAKQSAKPSQQNFRRAGLNVAEEKTEYSKRTEYRHDYRSYRQ